MSILNLKSNRIVIYSLSFLLPLFIMLLACMLNQVYPFGNNTLVIWDCDGQYISYLAYLKTIFNSGNDFLYTFSKTMGGDMIGLSAYYLLSPLNFIVFLLPDSYLPVSVFIIILLKIGLCGLTFNMFINRNCFSDWHSLIFSVSYALMAYNMSYFWDIMWLDGVILLPLISFGIDKIVNNESCSLYCGALSLALITNYYIGFMLCVFSFLYFTYKICLSINWIHEIKKYKNIVLKYFVFSLLSVGISAFVLVPTFFSLKGGKAQFSLSTLEFKENYNFLDIFTKLYTNSMNTNQLIDGLPNIFCGIFIVLMLMLYFLSRKIKTKEKFLSTALLASVLISFHVNTFNLIWHGLNPPNWFPYRYSFTFTFLILLFSYKAFKSLDISKNKKYLTYSYIGFVAFTILLFRKDYEFISSDYIYFDLLLFSVFCVLIYALKFSRKRLGLFVLTIAFLHIFDLFINSYHSINKLQTLYSAKMDNYVDYIYNTENTLNKVKDYDSSFYRLEKTFQRNHNDAMQFNYNGLSHFSSCEKDFVKTFMGKMGFRNNINWAFYHNGSTTSAESLLGVKYLLVNSLNNKPYQTLDFHNNTYILKNNFSLPIGFLVNDEIFNVSLSEQNNVFKIQNDIWKAITNNNFDDIFTPCNVSNKQIHNLYEYEQENFTEYLKINPKVDSYISYKIPIYNESPLYVYLNAPHNQNSEIYVNGKSLGDYFMTLRWDAVCLGNFKSGEVVDFTVKLNDDSLKISDSLFYHENLDILKESHSYLSGGFCETQKLTSSHLVSTFNASNNYSYALFSIPYEDDWTVTVDNNQVQPLMAFDCMLSVPISSGGQHIINLKYHPKGLILGIILSLVSFTISILYFISEYFKKHKKGNL